PWIDANFRTYAEYDGRAVSGFSMGGFGALKYAAKYYGHFASVS
ncbi:alpha/beta hydrolase-fold protein, partial [Streptomyces baarnensis]